MSHIKTYLRIKPTKRQYEDYDTSADSLYIRIPDIVRDQNGNASIRPRGGTVNHQFQFAQVFSDKASQKEIFQSCAKDIIDGFLNGYNGTIFAYGQTGSGKTFTMEGGARQFEDRGIAPRVLSYVYQRLTSRVNDDITVHVSFMEIYQEVGYDLLNTAARNSSTVTPFPKVAVVEGAQGTCLVRNLSSHLATNENVAQSLLLQGTANRKVAETSMNQRSSRSHAVFTIQISIKKQGEDTIIKSKLHLVDLAGSERVAKTKINGQQLNEAKFINLSLHYLEGVIIALQHKASGLPGKLPQPNYALYNRSQRNHPYRRTDKSDRWVSSLRPSSADGYSRPNTSKHVPYRNSLLTMVLRDSLGGNCQTAMIATISLEEENLSESLSTCRFAQRVACITNALRRNEEIDDRSMIKRLRKRISDLETEVALLRAGQDDGSERAIEDATHSGTVLIESKLTDEEKMDVARVVQGYLGGHVKDPINAGVNNPLKFRECLRLLRTMVIDQYIQLEDDHSNITQRTKSVISNPHKDQSQGQRPISSSSQKSAISNATSGFDETMLPEKLAKIDEKRPNSAPMSGSQKIPNGSTAGRGSTKHAWSKPSRGHHEEKVVIKGKEQYKSPYEKKREAEIKKLTSKVEKTREVQSEQQRHLQEFSDNVREQQLLLLQTELRRRLEECEKQVIVQRARVTLLRKTNADPDTIKAEKLVEKQLRKRKAKMERRADFINSQLEKVQEKKDDGIGSEVTEGSTLKRSESLNEKIPDNGRKDGRMNSRQVLEMLQKQDSKQEKTQAEIEKRQMIARHSLLELKEIATRQKLLEFRNKLKQPSTRGSSRPWSGDSPNQNFSADGQMEGGEDSATNPPDQVIAEVSENDNVDTETSSHKSRTVDTNSPFRYFSSRGSHRSYDIPKRKVSDMWDNAYSLPKQDSWLDTLNKNNMELYKPADLATSPIKECGYEDLPDIPTDLLAHNAASIYPDEDSLHYFKDIESEEKDKMHSAGISGEDVDYERSSFHSEKLVVQGHDEMYDNIDESYSQNMGNQNATDAEKSQTRAATNDSHLEILFPSEYVNQGHNDSFDGRKMGISHKTFDEALNRMLEAEGEHNNGPLTISKQDYDQFARVPRYGKKVSSESMNHRTRKSPSPVTQSFVKTNNVYNTTETKVAAKSSSNIYTTKGTKVNPRSSPNAKRGSTVARASVTGNRDAVPKWEQEANLTMTDKLSKYLEMDMLSHKGKKVRSYEESDLKPYHRPSIQDEEAMPTTTLGWHRKLAQSKPDIDLDKFTPKIKALKDEEREDAYMRSAREQKERVIRIRQAQKAAGIIQKAWRNYSQK